VVRILGKITVHKKNKDFSLWSCNFDYNPNDHIAFALITIKIKYLNTELHIIECGNDF
jgi:hypothetical protein